MVIISIREVQVLCSIGKMAVTAVAPIFQNTVPLPASIPTTTLNMKFHQQAINYLKPL